MKAIILAAGQGKRLLPVTRDIPKCLVPVAGRTVLAWQLHVLAEAGVDEAVVVTGFHAGAIDDELAARPLPIVVRTLFNPLHAVADNLMSCVAAAPEMDGDFLLLNGDTLIEPAVVARLLAAPHVPVSVAVVHKAFYDEDDMKVRAGLGWLDHVGKDLAPARTDGEAIGISCYRGDGPGLFVEALDEIRLQDDANRRWYLAAIERLALRGLVRTVSVDGCGYAELDYPADFARLEALARSWLDRGAAQTPHRDATRVRYAAFGARRCASQSF